MRLVLFAAILVLPAAAVSAQEQPLPQSQTRPVDNGPTTPGANNAYQGGGVVLQGAPGAPAPAPSAARDLPPNPPPAR